MTDAPHRDIGEQNPETSADLETVKLRLTHPHPLISRTTYQRGARNNVGHSLSNDYDGVDVRVSREKFRLALAVCDRLFKTLEKRGLTVRNDQDYNSRGTYAYSGHYDKCQIWLEEEYRRIAHILTTKEKADEAKYSFHSAPKWDFVPTGVLKLHPGGIVDLTSQQVFDDLILRAVAQIMDTIQHAREQRQEREETQRQETARQWREAQEKSRIKSLHESAEALHRYRLLIDYIEEVRRFRRVPSAQLREGQTVEEWLRWAQTQARVIHPLGY